MPSFTLTGIIRTPGNIPQNSRPLQGIFRPAYQTHIDVVNASGERAAAEIIAVSKTFSMDKIMPLIDKPKKVNIPKAKVIEMISPDIGTEMTMKTAKAILEILELGQDIEWRKDTRGNFTAWK